MEHLALHTYPSKKCGDFSLTRATKHRSRKQWYLLTPEIQSPRRNKNSSRRDSSAKIWTPAATKNRPAKEDLDLIVNNAKSDTANKKRKILTATITQIEILSKDVNAFNDNMSKINNGIQQTRNTTCPATSG
jgi:hypothetical protein